MRRDQLVGRILDLRWVELTTAAAKAIEGIVIDRILNLSAYPPAPDPSPVRATPGPRRMDNIVCEALVSVRSTERDKIPTRMRISPRRKPFLRS